MDIVLLRKANEIRKIYKAISYVEGGYIKSVINNKVVTVPSGLEMPDIEKQEQDFGCLIKQMKNWDSIKNNIDKLLDENYIGELELLLVCSGLSRIFNIGDIFLTEGCIYFLGERFTDKRQLLTEIPVIVEKAKKRELGSGKLFKDLVKLAEDVEYLQSERAAVLDGIAYIADSVSVFNAKKSSYFMEGYIKLDKVIWSRVDRSKFRTIKTDHCDISILETLYFENLTTVYRSVKRFEESRLIHRPYPIAILEDGEYAYYFELEK